MKKILIKSIVIFLCCTLILPELCMALDSSQSYRFELTVNSDVTAAVAVGDEINLELKLERTDSAKTGSYQLYAVQDEIIYDSRYFSFVEGSEVMAEGYNFNISTMEDGVRKRVIISKLSFSPDGIEAPDNQLIASFKLKTLRAGEDLVIRSKDFKVNSKTADIYQTRANDIIIKIAQNTTVPDGGDSPSGGTPPGGGEAPAEEEPGVHICHCECFKDVDQSLWYHEAVDYVIENGLFLGSSDTTFEPDTPMSRAMLVTVLWRLEGKPASFAATYFEDVGDRLWYTEAVSWASSNKIVEGYGSGLFAPNDSLTREQTATILRRFAVFKGYDVSMGDKLEAFGDAGTVSDWALESMQWAVGERLIFGVDESTVAPLGKASRAQVAAILMRFIENLA